MSETARFDEPTLPPPSEGTAAELRERRPGGPGIERFGDYELLSEIARGGMGVVFRARQVSLNRIVALKMILEGQLADEQAIARFRAEAEAAAGLNHPGIVPVFEVGESDGRCYFTMALVEGESLAACLTRGPLPARITAEVTRKIAEATAFAHRHGIVHRDLKPANILLDGASSNATACELCPRITDFGLAKQVKSDSGLTATGQILGTPSFMAPEQASGKSSAIGPAADVYSIGAILYASLTGRPPFQRATPMETLLEVLERDPAPPRLLNGQVDRDLETICLKCLEKDSTRRYPSAQALADDLGRYLDGGSISVASVNLIDRVTRTLNRSRHDAAFGTWSTILLWFAAIVFAGEAAIYWHALPGPPYRFWLGTVIRVLQFGLMGVVLFSQRRRWSNSLGAMERQMLALWTGFFVACHVAAAATLLQTPPGEPAEVLNVYPPLAVISGLTWFLLGGTHWGWCFAIGIAFFVQALIMPFALRIAPLEFGAAWSVSLALVGLRLRRLSRQT